MDNEAAWARELPEYLRDYLNPSDKQRASSLTYLVPFKPHKGLTGTLNKQREEVRAILEMLGFTTHEQSVVVGFYFNVQQFLRFMKEKSQ